MFAGLRRAATARRQGGAARLKSALKSENKNYNHFTPIKGQASALFTIETSFFARAPNPSCAQHSLC
jgi:hypothetical protein